MIKSRSSRLDYSVDWTEWLDGDTVQSSQWNVVGATKDSEIHTSAIATVWVSGGTGSAARLTNTITTTAGRIDSRSISLRIVDR